MKRHLFLVALCVCDVVAFAQPMRGPESTDPVLAQQLRKAALRDVLQMSRRADARGDVQGTKSAQPVAAPRHLSPPELAEMREQLRRQQRSERARP